MKPYYSCAYGGLYKGDCLEVMPFLKQDSVNCSFADLPYAETGNSWDSLVPLNPMFENLERLVKENGAMLFSGTFRFGTKLYISGEHLYKYDWVWEKDNGTNAPNVNYQPFRIHENIYVFGKGRVTNGTRTPMFYNPQKTEGKPYSQKSGRMSENWKGGLKNVVTENKSGLRHPKTIQKFNRDKSSLHPTQKPVALLEYLIKTYSLPQQLVLDFTAGSSSTAIACINTNRKFIMIEKEEKYCEISAKRIEEHINKMWSDL